MAVWAVLSTPSQQSVVDPRVRLVGEWGEPGTVGSSYELAMRGRPTMRLRVTDAVPGECHMGDIEFRGRVRGTHEARLRADGAGCVLAYTFSFETPLLLSPLQRIFGHRQLGRWLEGVARASAAQPRQ